jgi:hypothetical protein
LVKNTTVISNASQLVGANLDNRYAVKVHEREFIDEAPMWIPTSKIDIPGEENIEFVIESLSQESKVYL